MRPKNYQGYFVLLLVTTLRKVSNICDDIAHSATPIKEVCLEPSWPSCGHGLNSTYMAWRQKIWSNLWYFWNLWVKGIQTVYTLSKLVDIWEETLSEYLKRQISNIKDKTVRTSESPVWTATVQLYKSPHCRQNLVGVKKKTAARKNQLTLEKKAVGLFLCKEWWTTSLFILFPGLSDIIAQSADGTAKLLI